MRSVKLFGLVLVVLALGREATAQQQEVDQAKCLQSGGKSWDMTLAKPPRCECRREDNLVNAINVCGDCGKNNPLCDRCVPLGTSDCVKLVRHVQVPARRDPIADCRAACQSQKDVAQWNPRAPKDVRCEPRDAEQYVAGACSVSPVPAAVREARSAADALAFCQAQCNELGPAAMWTPDALPEARCQPTDNKAFVAGPCTIAPKGQGDPALLCATMCKDSGGTLVGGDCQCPHGKAHTNSCLCLQESPTDVNIRSTTEVHEQPVLGLGLVLRALGLVESKGLYVPVGFAPSLVLRIRPWKTDVDLTIAGGPLVTGKGGDTPDVPVGVAFAVGSRIYVNKYWGMLIDLDGNWYAVDRNGEAYAASGGARVGPAFRKRLDPGVLYVDAGLGGAYLAPDEETAFIWGGSAGIIWP